MKNDQKTRKQRMLQKALPKNEKGEMERKETDSSGIIYDDIFWEIQF